MSVIPPSINDYLNFIEQKQPLWAVAPASIGLTTTTVAAMGAQNTKVRDAFDAALAARDLSKSATTKMHGELTVSRSQVADLVRQIKTFAESSTNPPAVYAAAGIDPPAPPAPLSAPGKPTDFSVTLNPDGSITLSWASTNSTASTGAFFMVSRKLPGQSAFTGIGGAPGSTSESRRPSFTDTTIPATAASQGAQYIVQGFRGTRAGQPSDATIVQFGLDGGGGFAAATVKMAA